MKKLLSFLGAICLTSISATGAVACDVAKPDLNLYDLSGDETRGIVAEVNKDVTAGTVKTFNDFIQDFAKKMVASTTDFYKKFGAVTTDEVAKQLSFKFYDDFLDDKDHFDFRDTTSKDGKKANLITDMSTNIVPQHWYYLKIGGVTSGSKYFINGDNSGVYLGSQGMDEQYRLIDSFKQNSAESNASGKTMAELILDDVKPQITMKGEDFADTVFKKINQIIESDRNVTNWVDLNLQNSSISFLTATQDDVSKAVTSYDFSDGGSSLGDNYVKKSIKQLSEANKNSPLSAFTDDAQAKSLYFIIGNTKVKNDYVSSATSYFTGAQDAKKIFHVNIVPSTL